MKYSPILILTFFMLFTACETFLETDSPSAFTGQYVFSNEDDARKAINSVYQTLANSSYDQHLSTIFSNNTDIESGHVHAGADNTRRDIWSYRATSSNGDILGPWNNCYLGINRANECIAGIMDSDLYNEGNERMVHMVGEALALRAYYYYLLINYWGDVPFKTTPTQAGDEFYLPRTNRDTILSHVIQDLIEIEPEMYWADQLPEGIERISRDFVIGLITKLAITRGGYALRKDGTMKRADDYLDYYGIANTYAKKLIELRPRQLDEDFQQMFRNQCENIQTINQDIIFEVPYLSGTNGDVGWNLGLSVDAGQHDYGAGNNFINLPASYYHSFDTTDLRLPVSCAIYYYDQDFIQQPVSWVIFISTHKWSRTWMPTPAGETSAKGTGINFPILRYADVLLMLAETENELNNGPTQLAIDVFSEVRERAFPDHLYTEKVENYIASKSSKEAFFDALVDERAWEFGGECIRKFDLIRWNLLGEKIMETKETLSEMAESAFVTDGQYSHLPDYLYYRHDVEGNIEFYNKYVRPDEIPPIKDSPNIGDNPDGYETVRWLTGLSKEQYEGEETGPIDYVDIQWSGYTDYAVTGEEPVPYILPIHITIVNSSREALDNEGYLLTF